MLMRLVLAPKAVEVEVAVQEVEEEAEVEEDQEVGGASSKRPACSLHADKHSDLPVVGRS